MIDEKTFIQFILEHENDDTAALLLSSSRFPGIDVSLAVNCINARNKIKYKIPSWYKYPSLIFPFPISIEQCSSELTALYKQRFVSESDTVADLTGGLGMDTWAYSLKSKQVWYYERNSSLSSAAKSNFMVLKADNINVITANIDVLYIENKINKKFNLVFLDPARRGKTGEKLYSIKDCEPDFFELKESLFTLSNRILIKISPMADISFTLGLLPETTEVHIISVNNECKELLFLLDKNVNESDPLIIAVNISHGEESIFKFHIPQEKEAEPIFISRKEIHNMKYLYEPHKSILKSGAFKLISSLYNVFKLSVSSHLYLSDICIDNFPGKTYKILDIFDYNRQTAKMLHTKYPKASVSSKGFPQSSSTLAKTLKISEGDSYHIFGCTLQTKEKILICTQPLTPLLSKYIIFK